MIPTLVKLYNICSIGNGKELLADQRCTWTLFFVGIRKFDVGLGDLDDDILRFFKTQIWLNGRWWHSKASCGLELYIDLKIRTSPG